jgi:Ca-activated chloride channel family protein
MPDLPFRLADPVLLLLLLVATAVFVLYRQQSRLRGHGAFVLSTVTPLQGIAPSWRIRFRWLLPLLRFSAIALIVTALARPQAGKASGKVLAQGIDIVIALDLSGSMLDPGLSSLTKLAGAKVAIDKFIAARKNDRVGFVIFESQSRVMSPLTLDYHALEQIVQKSNNGLVPDGTAIGLGITDGVNLLRDSRARSRVIILATDGENNQHQIEPEQAAAIAASLKIKLYTIGMFAQNETVATSQIDEKSMQKWAAATGGFYGRAQSGSQLQHIFDEISRLETSQIERTHYTSFDELAAWFVVPALILLAVEALLGATVLRRVP